ncbi:MAG: putative response regulator, CheY [Verrucomicrobiales bacterium]|nr:putative response regulator, CheY [Verrucomicrobiales bacterium]
MSYSSATTNVLVLEDDADDAILIRRAFKATACRVFVCRNTSEARAYFLGSGMYADRELFPFPELFVTDLRLGEESGIEFLAWVRAFPASKDLAVIVLSGAVTSSEILAVQRLRAARVLIKPADPVALQNLLILAAREFCPAGERYENESEASRFQVGALG